MNKILIALVLVIIFAGHLFANNYNSTNERYEEFLNEQNPEDKKLDQNKPSMYDFFNDERFRDFFQNKQNDLFEDWKKRNPWFDRYDNTFPAGSAPRLGLNIILKEMFEDGYLDANLKFNNKNDYDELDRRLGEKPLITLYKKHKDSTLNFEEKAELSIDNHRQTCRNIGFNDNTEGMSECIKDLYLRTLDNEKALSIEKQRKVLDQKRKIEIEEQKKLIAKKNSEKNLNDAIRRIERYESIEGLCKRKANVEALIIKPGELSGFGAYENKARRLFNQCMENNKCYSINSCG